MVDDSGSSNQLQTPEPAPKFGWRRRLPVLLSAIGLVIALIVIAILATKLMDAGSGADDRTISVTGEAVLQETPDQYLLYPNYSFKNADKAAAIDEMTKKSDAVVAGLKQAGIADKDIKTNSSGYETPSYSDRMMPATPPDADYNYSFQLTITVKDKALAQKVQDYLLTTAPSGSVSPQAGFSDAKRKSLEAKARDQATKDARSKADQSAKNLGFEVGDVKSVADGTGFVQPFDTKAAPGTGEATTDMARPQMAIQPGQNDFSYSVTVVYTIR